MDACQSSAETRLKEIDLEVGNPVVLQFFDLEGNCKYIVATQ